MHIIAIGNNYPRVKQSFKENEKVTLPENNEKGEKKPLKTEKVLPLASAALAAISLGVAIYSTKGRNNSASKNEAKKAAEEAADKMSKPLKESIDKLSQDINKVTEKMTNVQKDIDKVNGIAQKADEALASVSGLREGIEKGLSEIGNKSHNFTVRTVEVNGKHLELATVMHGYGPKEHSLAKELQTESAKRILGAVPKINPSENITARFVTAEYAGFAKTGGMAIVPKELVSNIGAYVNEKQNIELLVDTPLYLGQVENDKFFELIPNGNNQFLYNAKTKNQTQTMAVLEEIGEFPITLYGDEKQNETVKMYRSNVLTAPVDFKQTLAQLKPETARDVEITLAKGMTKKVGPLIFQPAIHHNSVSLNIDNHDVTVDYELFLNLFDEKAVDIIERFLEAGQVVKKDDIVKMMKAEAERAEIEKMRSEGINPEEFKQRLDNKNFNIKLIKDSVKPESIIEILYNKDKSEKLIKQITRDGLPNFTIRPKTSESVMTEYRVIFYDNKRFNMNGPLNADINKTIYNDQTVESGETERFITFSKLFYEHIQPENQRFLKVPMNADIVIGNDWHTGPISAMMRLLTPARKAFGLEPEAADKIQNTPIITLMHNFKLSGVVSHSQAKLLNLMFGEHAAKIVENAYAPKDANLPMHLWNGMCSGDCINPQTMAMQYSDYVPFVSVGNFNEVSTEPARGGANHHLAALRGRVGQYANKKYIESIAMANGIYPDQIGNKTSGGITNGCDRVNNIITKEKARFVELHLGLPVNSLMSIEDVECLNLEGKNGEYIVHQNNKKVNLEKVIKDINLAKDTKGAINPMKLFDIENTDLTGVDENTMVIAMAGRIVDQKGIDIHSEGILKYYQTGNFDKENPPVCYIQGTGDKKFIEAFLRVKKEVAKISPKAANRMVFANLFSETGRYDACKMFSDFSSMTSWDEPCGLVHKEIAYASGAIPIVNKVGGLTDGLNEYGKDLENQNAIFVNFIDKDNHPYEEALAYNSENFAKGLAKSQEWYNNKESFAKGIRSSYRGNYDWLTGKIQQYIDVLKDRGVIKPDV